MISRSPAVHAMLLFVAVYPRVAFADVDASAPLVGSCIENIPEGGARPEIRDTFPTRGTTGYAATLVVVVEHGKGERVLPNGFELQSASEASKELRVAGFVVPDQNGPAKVRLATGTNPAKPEKVTTTFEFPLVPLPPEPGRHTLTLPSMPIAVARARGEIATVCTGAHRIMIDDATASTPEASPRPNPAPRMQREDWATLRTALTWIGVGLLVGIIVAYAAWKWLKRPRPLPPPPPPRPPWDVALERLDEVRHAGLLDVGRFGEYFDRVNDAIRSYLGARFGFDGLESTSDEILQKMQRSAAPPWVTSEVHTFLQECDLVKFANVMPTIEACTNVLAIGEKVVHGTMPVAKPQSADGASKPEGRP